MNINNIPTSNVMPFLKSEVERLSGIDGLCNSFIINLDAGINEDTLDNIKTNKKQSNWILMTVTLKL